jgi:hypothetical protein
MRLFHTLFSKIRQICTSPVGHQRPWNRGFFRHLIYPIRTPQSLPEYHYEGRFFRQGFQKLGNGGEMAFEKSFIQLFSETISHFSD